MVDGCLACEAAPMECGLLTGARAVPVWFSMQPALKNADIGVAMGIMGTEVAKSAADVILMDDDFCSIVNGIEEGRTLFDNLTKTIGYTLTHLVPELVAVIINIVFMVPAGMSTLMILSIDLVTEVSVARRP
jgi:sodium/potassium-transporting ATPase subunit alpha